MLRKFRNILLIITSVILLWLLWSFFSHHIPRRKHCSTDHQLTVLTYNTQGMAINKSLDHKMNMLRYINKQDADIVCLQEVLVYKSDKRLTLAKLREAMSQYPYTYYDFKLYNQQRQFGNVVFSRYPLINKKTIRFESRTNISSQCDVVVNHDTIRLIVNHLESFHINNEDLNLEDLNVGSFQESTLGKKLVRANKLRRTQVSALCKAIRKSPYPIVAVGDFNSLPISWVYWRMNLGLRDSFAESSFGRYGGTYQRKGLKARIDYIFLSRSFQPIECRVGTEEHSDHYPVIATFGW